MTQSESPKERSSPAAQSQTGKKDSQKVAHYEENHYFCSQLFD
jgi:hypothetical protein